METDKLSPILFIPHGAGPLPLLGDDSHKEMISFLNLIRPCLGQPSAIVVISAHWEAKVTTITNSKNPALIYDYYGFPEASYQIEYSAPGAPQLANEIAEILRQQDLPVALDDQRGFDHGVFVPLKILFPEANIPCIQLSLFMHLQPKAHIALGKALASLREANVLVIGSGFSFHNIGAFFSENQQLSNSQNDAFQDWLIDTCVNPEISPEDREALLLDWANAPSARYCHPREEHLLPLHMCAGLAGLEPAKLVFDNKVAGKRACAFLW